MISEWINLTDRFGDGTCIRRDSVKRFYFDSVIVPDAEHGKRTLYGTTLALDNGEFVFVLEELDEVKQLMFSIE